MIIEDFEKFINEVSTENASEDYWYDIGIDEAQNLLVRFLQEDWSLLRKLIKNKSVEWQKKVIYSFDGENAEQEIRVILEVINTDDSELFEMCVDSLRYLVNENTRNLILETPELLERVELLVLENNSMIKKIYKDFLEKIRI